MQRRFVVSRHRWVPTRPFAALSIQWPIYSAPSRDTNRLRCFGSARPLPSPSRMKVVDLLEVSKQFRSKETNYIHEDETLEEAVKCISQNENSATLVVVNKQHQVVGLITNRLALQRVARMHATGKQTDWTIKVSEVALPARKVLYVSPDDSLEDCRAIMALSGIGELPVLQGSKLLGTVSLIDIASLLHRHDAQYNPDPTSAKSDYINLILPRKGLPPNTSLDPTVVQQYVHRPNTLCPSTSNQSNTLLPPSKHTHRNNWTYYLHSFAMSIPHPQKKETGGEDAFFLGLVPHEGASSIPSQPLESHSIPTITEGTQGPVQVLTMGVADGVGSWFEKGLSARPYAHALMVAAHQAVQVAYANHHDMEPSEILHAAWSTVQSHEIQGSATACIVSLDPTSCELHGINLGDSGFVIIRDKTSDLATARVRGTLDGSMTRKIRNRDRDLTPAGRRKGAHVTYRSPQQLHYFNCPFQLGFANATVVNDVVKDLTNTSHAIRRDKALFETPENGVRLRVPVREGDLILLATDGLFDNVDEDVLLDMVRLEPNVAILTQKLIAKAYDLSLDRTRDSPFARLAKENDLMWGGGMPDDITIIAARVRKHKN
ncbi:hypothetical protein CCR75_006609 [Bremia lactucae]|uniref:Protein phosphatase n=1 Tax=Bremia lactucae TaxID=4779 RepID=A0A976FIL5_BRELC|nr:hypothetical protein CCR75_006609 [Bremia lactucae]